MLKYGLTLELQPWDVILLFLIYLSIRRLLILGVTTYREGKVTRDGYPIFIIQIESLNRMKEYGAHTLKFLHLQRFIDDFLRSINFWISSWNSRIFWSYVWFTETIDSWYRVSHDLLVGSRIVLDSSHDLFIVSHRFLVRSYDLLDINTNEQKKSGKRPINRGNTLKKYGKQIKNLGKPYNICRNSWICLV